MSDTMTIDGLPLDDFSDATTFIKDMFLAYGTPMPELPIPDVCRILHQMHWAMTAWAANPGGSLDFDHPKLARYHAYLRVVDEFFWHYLSALPWNERPEFPWPVL